MEKFSMELEGRNRTVISCFSQVEQALYELCDDEPSFAVLSWDEEEYIQCALLDDGRASVEVRGTFDGEKRHYRRYTDDGGELVGFFRSYYAGGLSMEGWEDVSKEFFREAITFGEEEKEGNPYRVLLNSEHKAFAAKQLMKILGILSCQNAQVLAEMDRSLRDPAKLKEAENREENFILCQWVLAEASFAAWIPQDLSFNRADLKWICLQWREMIHLLKEIRAVVSMSQEEERNVKAFEEVLDKLMALRGISVNYHNSLFNTRRNAYITAWCCVSDGELEDQAGIHLCMLGRDENQYPFALVDCKEAKELWELSFSIGMRACSLREHSAMSAGSMRIVTDAEERIKLWKSTGFLRAKEKGCHAQG